MRILIAEDDVDISKALVTILEKNNYGVDAVYNGEDAYEYAITGNYDCMILDIMMPKMDGIEVLTKLRSERYTIPTLILTAKTEIDDRVTGLDAGADDYLVKPFDMKELLARVRAILRRQDAYQPDEIEYNGMKLNKSTFELVYEDKIIRLMGKEFQMLEMLMKFPGKVVQSEEFMEHIWGWDSEVEVSIVWVYISNIRKKINMIKAPVEVKAVRGVGYCIGKKE